MGGCASSKLNDLPSVLLCHDRCTFLSKSIRNLISFSQSHSHYALSLRRLSLSLSRFLYHSFFNSSPSQSDRCIHSRDSHDLTALSASSDWHKVPAVVFASSVQDEEHSSSSSYSSPPPPPPPLTPSSGWDLLSFFDSYERVEMHRSFKQAREEGGVGFSEEKVEEGDGRMGLKGGGSDGGEGCGSKLLYVVASFQPLMEKVAGSCGDVSKMLVSVESSATSTCEGTETTSANISSVMENLWMWERKLYNEVKEEEKFKLIREKKGRQLGAMIEKGAEIHVITEAKSVITALSINIKIAVDTVDNISLAIKKLQNEELWPHIVSLFNGLKEMWKGMAEIHKKLSLAIAQAKGLVTAMTKTDATRTESHSEAMTQLKLDFQYCDESFSSWMDAQRDYIKVMTHWLTAPLPYHDPPKRADSDPDYPKKPDAGSPSPFAFCHGWSHAMDSDAIRVREVVDSMKECVALLDPFCVGPARDELHPGGRSKRKVKASAKEKQKVRKTRDNKVDVIHHTPEEDGLHACLVRVFEGMEAVAETSHHFYEQVSHTFCEAPPIR